MPGLLNLLRSLSSSDLLQKLFSARKSPPLEAPQLSRCETDILLDCIASTRTHICELEQRNTSLHANTEAVCRSIQHKQPDFTPPIATRLPEVFQEAVISSSDDRLDNSAALSKYPTDAPEAERDIFTQTSIKSEDMALMVDNESDLQVQLVFLVLKKAELEVEVVKFRVNLVFWEGLYKQIRFMYRHKLKEEDRTRSHFYTWRPSPPSLLGQWSFDADSIPSEYTKGMGMDTSLKHPIPRKGVPIREVIGRIKATVLSLFRPGTNRDYSWSEHDDLFLPESSDMRAKETSSTTKPETTNDAKQRATRGFDPAVNIRVDFEYATEELRRITSV